MALNLEEKQAVVSEIAAIAAKSYSVVAAEYNGMTVAEMTALRNKARSGNVHVCVVKNTLARRAIEGTDFACMQKSLVGPLVLAFSQEDPGGAPRVISDFLKANANTKLVVKAAAIGGNLYPPEEISRLAKLPTKNQALSQLMSVIKAPIQKLVRTLAEPHTKLVRTLAAVKDKNNKNNENETASDNEATS